jgi:hypothetical protein
MGLKRVVRCEVLVLGDGWGGGGRPAKVCAFVAFLHQLRILVLRVFEYQLHAVCSVPLHLTSSLPVSRPPCSRGADGNR